MKNYPETLISNPLFKNIKSEELPLLLNCLSARIRVFEKNSYIFTEGDTLTHIGIIVSGRAHVIKDDHWGNRAILSELSDGDLFGEAFAFAGEGISPVSVISISKCEVLFIDYTKILHTCISPCSFHSEIISNLVKILAQKTVMLTQKMHFITQKKTRGKLLSYLSAQKERTGSNTFVIPFNRQELADFLSVERSAMTRELCRMRDEGLLEFRKNRFTLK